MSQDSLHLKSDAFPAISLLDSYYDRDVTRLSDRGMASNMIGDRWSEVCTDVLASWPGTSVLLPSGEEVMVERVHRLDDISEISRIASRRKLQNPDFIVEGRLGGERVMMAADAKFSIDTAKAAQVSAETLTALLEVGPLITDLIPDLDTSAHARDGLFLSPDMPITNYVMLRKRGRLSVRVSTEQVKRIPVAPVPFLKPMEGSRLMGTLASIDDFRDDIRSNMLLALYYFRLVRACYGSYSDMTSPIIGPPDAGIGSVAELESQTASMAKNARSSWDVVLQWDARAEQVRRQREAVFAAMPFPIPNKDVRDRVVQESELRGLVAPSINSVRKRLGAWHRQQFDERLGVVLPPVADLPQLLQQIQMIGGEIEPLVDDAFNEIIDEVFASQPQLEDQPETGSEARDIMS